MRLVEEIAKGSDPNVYFSSSINLKASSSKRSMYSSSNSTLSRKRLAAGAYNISQLQANVTDSQINEYLIESKKSVKRLQQLDRENHADSGANGSGGTGSSGGGTSSAPGNKIELPKSGYNVDFKGFSSSDYPIFDLVSYSQSINKNINARTYKVGKTVHTRKILASRKTLNNYYDEDVHSTNIIKGEKYYSVIDDDHALIPGKKLCSICGSNAVNVCVKCGSRFCGLACSTVHKETRCTY